jgi:CheY-like chemotaxis protein
MSSGKTGTDFPQLKGVRILVVEDETMLFFLAEDMLLELGCAEVSHASRVSEALTLLDKARPDVAMLDVNLAGQPAYPVAERLAAANIPFVFATGYGIEGIPAQWASRPIVQKPFTLAMLAGAIGRALGNRPENPSSSAPDSP